MTGRWLFGVAVAALGATCMAPEPAETPVAAPPSPTVLAAAAPSSTAATPTAPAAVATVSSERLETGRASFYSDRLTGRKTASGERYDPGKLTAAHRTLAFGTTVRVLRPDGRFVDVRINDRGPFVRGRVIDLSRKAAEAIGLVRDGTADVELRLLSDQPG